MVGMNRAGMAGTCGPLARAQYSAVLHMRWRMLLNSLRSKRGKFELGARIALTLFFCVAGLLVGVLFGFMSWQFAASRHLYRVVGLLWAVLLIWQLLPVMVATAQESPNLSMLLRFPVNFSSYTLLYLALGLFDLASLAGWISLFSIWLGVSLARPALVLWVAMVVVIFAAFNLLLSRMIFAWVDRWLAQRRTREILGFVFLIFFVGLQLLNPAYHPHNAGDRRSMTGPAPMRALKTLEAAQQFLPPGLAARSVYAADSGRRAQAAGLLGGVAGYAAAAGLLLGIRLRAEYRGESLGEAPRATVVRRSTGSASLAGESRSRSPRGLIAGPIGGILTKELRILSRSSVMLFSMFTPLIFLFLFGGTMRADHPSSIQYGLPIGVAYAFLPLTRQVCNSLGGEGAGIQLYFLSPTPLRTVMMAKNLFQLGLFLIELAAASSIVLYRFGRPGPELAMTTFCWLLFAVPANLAAGNILSITMAYRMTMTRLSREQGSVGNGLLSLLIQLLTFATGAAIYLPLAFQGYRALAAPILLLLAVGAVFAWLRVLSNIDRIAFARRESLIAALVRAA